MTSEAKDAQACAVPLVERLLSVPKDAREMIEVGYCHHRNVPYGAMCHEAAARVDKQNDKIAALEAQVVELRRAVSLFIGVSGPKANEQMLRDTFVEVLSKTAADFSGKCVVDAEELETLRKDRDLINGFERIRADDVQARQISEDECQQELVGHFWQTITVQSPSLRDGMQASIDAVMAKKEGV